MQTKGRFVGSRRKARRGWWRTMPVTVCVCLGGLTAIVAIVADEQADREARMQRASLSVRASARIAEAVTPTIARLRDLAAATSEDTPGTVAGFDAVASGLLENQATNGVGLIEPVRAGERATFEREHGAIRGLRDGRPFGRARRQAMYYVVAAALTRPGQPHNIDTNLGEEPARNAVLTAAASTGLPRATPPVRRVGERDYATVLYVPVYAPSTSASDTRATGTPSTHATGTAGTSTPPPPSTRIADLRGFVSSSYNYALLAPEVLAALPKGTALALYDGRSRLMGTGVSPHDPQDTRIALAGRAWELAVGEPAADLALTRTVLLVGGLLTLLLGALSVQATRRERCPGDGGPASGRARTRRARAAAVDRARPARPDANRDTAGVGREDPGGAGRRTADAARPAGGGDGQRTHDPARAAGAHDRHRRRADRARPVPADRRALRADP